MKPCPVIRLQANLKLIKILEALAKETPDLRFSQILLAFGFVKQERPANPELRISWQDEFYLEPDKLLERVEQQYENVTQKKFDYQDPK